MFLSTGLYTPDFGRDLARRLPSTGDGFFRSIIPTGTNKFNV
jgi:hypothetical protein